MAIRYYRMAADIGYSEAMVNLGVMYYEGVGVGVDRNVAFGYYKMAAEKANASALNDLGVMYFEAVPPDYISAARFFKQSADLGFVNGQINLANMYYEGYGTPKHYPTAFNYYQLAVDKQDPLAMNLLGEMYLNGQGVKQDYLQAYRLYSQAAEKGFKEAMKNLVRFKENGDLFLIRLSLEWPTSHSKLHQNCKSGILELYFVLLGEYMEIPKELILQIVRYIIPSWPPEAEPKNEELKQTEINNMDEQKQA